MKIDCIIGIDPGVSGGICVYRPGRTIEVIKMPRDLFTLKDWFLHMAEICTPIVFVEKVQLRTDDIDSPGKAFRVQKMLNEFEKLKTIISICEIPFVQVHPLKWQNALKVRLKGEDKKTRKNRFKSSAGKLYPELTPTLWNSDAVLIMHFGRYVLQNDLNWVLSNLPNSVHLKLFGNGK